MNTATDTKSLIIDKASELMMQHGIGGFSYKDISTPLGVKNAAIHYHFPTKSDLIMALIEAEREYLRKSTAEFMAYGGSAREQISGLFAYIMHQCRNNRPVCITGAIITNYESYSDELKEAHSQFNRELIGWLIKVLATGREQGEFHYQGDPKTKAAIIGATTQGARQLYRIHGAEYLQLIFDQIWLELGIDKA